MAESKVHICPECGEKINISAYMTLPGEYRIECPHCKTQLQPELHDFNRAVPLIIFILIIFMGINQRAGMTAFLIYVGVLTLLAYLVLLIGAYYFVKLKKIENQI